MDYPIELYMKQGRRAHLVGIGGVSMSALAEVLHDGGVTITGSDTQESASVRHLRERGIPIQIGHRAENVGTAECVIRTAAVHDDNPEIAAARQAGIPVFERAEGWGAIMRRYENALCVAGTHGKTTTTSMCTQIFLAARRDPTVMIGGTLPAIGAGHRVGKGETIILESCEYCNSFHAFHPTVAVILNIEADHLDFFGSLEEVCRSFQVFAQKLPPDGTLVVNCEDENAMQIAQNLGRQLVTFGIKAGDISVRDLKWERCFARFHLTYRGRDYARITLRVPGIYNVYNALAAAAAAIVLQVPAQAIEDGLGQFRGVNRRFEYKGSYEGAEIFDDYAHHPSELRALLDTVKKMGYERVICAFQPHTFTRTQEFFHQFAQVLRLADQVVLAEIYAAREDNETGISSRDLVPEIPGAIFCPDLSGVTEELRRLARPGDLILTVGAGDIYKAGEALLR